ncbi:MAG: GNAT family N-acetyltransferase [Actinomycetota bacterium]
MIEIGEEDPTGADVVALIEAHRAFSLTITPPEHAYAMPPEQVAGSDLVLVGARESGQLLGVGALREFDAATGEVKSMHTAAQARGRGVGRLVLEDLLARCRARGYHRVLLETGSMEEMAAARSLYESVGFERRAPYGHYTENGINLCYELSLQG